MVVLHLKKDLIMIIPDFINIFPITVLAVIAPNFRGSTGYGKSFEKKIYHDWGGNELERFRICNKMASFS